MMKIENHLPLLFLTVLLRVFVAVESDVRDGLRVLKSLTVNGRTWSQCFLFRGAKAFPSVPDKTVRHLVKTMCRMHCHNPASSNDHLWCVARPVVFKVGMVGVGFTSVAVLFFPAVRFYDQV